MISSLKIKTSSGTMNKSPRKKAARGAFSNGIWHCDCDPRHPAEHFQTKNGGQNHGRWCTICQSGSCGLATNHSPPLVYTCQKSQPKRCNFFLWDDDAKVREEAAILNNSRSETGPKIPTKPSQPARPLTPTHRSPAQQNHHGMATPNSKSRRSPVTSDESDFDWSASNDKALAEVGQALAMAAPETPRKVPRTPMFTSPGKRNHSEMVENNSTFSSTVGDDDIFNTPRSSEDVSGLLSPVESPMRRKPQDGNHYPINSALATDALRILERSNISPDAEQQLIELLNKHDLRTQGIAKGRDITRLALGNKDKKIADLEARIASLEAERETSKAVIAHMKSDIIQTSPGKSRKRGG